MALFAQVALDLPLKQSFTYTIGPEMAKKVEVGHRVVVPFGKREMTGYVIELLDAFSAAYELKPIKRVIDASPLYGRQTIDLAAWMSRYYLCSLGEALSMMIPGGRRELGLPALEVEEDLSFARIEQLSDEQDAAVQTILRSEKPMYYLYGVTGSGKSEVFLRCAEAVIAQGKAVIYLVPEITLTHQLAQQVSSRFANKVAILHSALTPSQRLKE
ncbi:MAG: AAA family ATPase, partial [Sphaerochaeta sp.]|nr:AAA family ATPase [Sphaerochaeta sp.]